MTLSLGTEPPDDDDSALGIFLVLLLVAVFAAVAINTVSWAVLP